MNQRRLKVALLGAGYICDVHAKALKRRPDVDIVAVCDRSLNKAQEASAKYAIPHVFSSLGDMLRCALDVVHVLLPPEQHIDAAQMILESERHVFLEKPMGLNSAGCRELVELARQKGLKLGVNHNFLFSRSFETLRRHATDGTLGTLDRVAINWLSPLGILQSGPFNHWMVREPANIFFELGPHVLSFAMDLLGPLDHFHASVSRPIDLPGGRRVYRHWHVHGLKDHTAVDVLLSLVPGRADRSVLVRGHGAVAKSDFERDVYYCDNGTGYGLQFDNYFSTINVVRQLGADAHRNLLRAIVGTLNKAPTSNPFGESVARSIDRFYETIDGQLDSRLDGEFGVKVIAECERIVGTIAFEAVRPTTQLKVVPPRQLPTVLVLGGTGFIGRYLVRALVQRGLGVRVATRSAEAANIVLAGLPIELVQGDLADPAFIDAALDNIEVVYDLAKADGSRWEDYYRQDVLVTKNVAQRALAKGVKRFIYTGTIASYYTASASDVITSDTPLDPKIRRRNHYARSKAVCESLLMDMHRANGLPVVILRPGIVIGSGSPPAHWGVGMFNSETHVQFWGNGRNKLPFVLVEDVAEALVLAMDKQGIDGQSFLLTDEPLLSARDYTNAVSEACGTRLRAESRPIWRFFLGEVLKEAVKYAIRHPNRKIPSFRDWACRTNRARFDSAKSRHVLGWKPVGTRDALIERGIARVVAEANR